MAIMNLFIIVLAILVGIVIIAWIVGMYNGFVRLKNNIKKAWSNINVLLKQRADELPKLIDTVKGYMKHEKSIMENITKARTAYLNASSMSEKAAADNMLTETLKSLFAVSENYPKLKANENFLKLQSRISGLENMLADRREFYNDSVNHYNIKRESFPDMIIANMMKLQPEKLFQVSEEDKKDVNVDFQGGK